MSRPWETAAGSRPWEGQQSLYPRTISVTRPPVGFGVGALPYQGLTKAGETSVVSGIPANVEIAASGRNSASGGLPGDAAGPIKWTITVPGSAMASLPLIQERDYVYDDLNRRFQVSAYQPTGIGAKIDCVRVLT